MGQHANPRETIAAIHADAPAENLFFAQYRYWMAGYSTRDIFCWDCAWDTLLRFVSRDSAPALYSEFHLFTRTLNEQARRKVEWRPDICRCLCRDEFLALRLVSASQQNDLDEELAAASDLLGADISSCRSGVDSVRTLLMASRLLAQALKNRRFVLAPIKRLPPASTLPHTPHGHTLQ